MNLDAEIVSSLNQLASSTPTTQATTIFLASWLPFIIVGIFAGYLLYSNRWNGYRKLLPLLWSLAAGLIARIFIASPIRYFFPRERPFLVLPIDRLIIIHAPSFPSGHAAFLFGFSTVVYHYHKKLGVLCFVLSTLVCIARVAAGVHYLSDILAGLIAGMVAAALVLKFLIPASRVH